MKNPTFDFWNQILEVTKYRQPLYSILIAIPLLIFGTIHAYKLALLLIRKIDIPFDKSRVAIYKKTREIFLPEWHDFTNLFFSQRD